jgi:hypothetical protein
MTSGNDKRLGHILNRTVKTKTGCLEYQGCVQANGYTRITVSRKSDYGHRHVYRLAKGPIPEGLDVRHKCDNRKCINPDHLEVGTRLQNMRDAVDRRRQARGFMLPHTKLSPFKRLEIVRLAILGEPYKSIGEKYGLCRQHIGQIAIKAGVKRNGIGK